jgi:transcriptional regulator with XRE-family HTH domain
LFVDLNSRIDAWRRHRGMTQRALAKAVGVTVGAVNAWVKGLSAPTQKNLQAIVNAFGITMTEFYGANFDAPPRARRTRAAA